MNPEKIVVVEDNPNNMRLMVDILRVGGFDSVTRVDGEDICEIVAEASPLAVLMDIQLPRWSGIELRRFLADDPRTRDVPVFAVTANCDGDAMRTYEAAGFADVFKKPIKVRELLMTLMNLRASCS